MSEQVFMINGQTFASCQCRFDRVCTAYDSALKIPVVIKGIDGRPKTIEKLNCCTQGGGVSCKHWRSQTMKEQGWYEPLANRSKPVLEVKA